MTTPNNTQKFSINRLIKLPQMARSILLTGTTNTIIVQSEPGCGKTSLLTYIAKLNGDQWRKVGDYCPTDKYQYIYVDCPNLQYGDITSNIPVKETKTLEEFVSGLFCMDDPRPKVIMFDEVLKIPKPIKGVVTRAMKERTAGARPFPKGSLVFGTSNNMIENLGDTTHAHEGNRVSYAQMAKPDIGVFMPWAIEHGLNDTVLACVKMNHETMLASYVTMSPDMLKVNGMVYNPYDPKVTFVSPRSIESVSHIVDQRLQLGDDTMFALVAGTWGEQATNLLETYVMMEKEIVPPEVIIADPLNAPIPANDIVMLITLFKSANGIKTQDHLSAYVQYVERLKSKEVQSVWALKIIKDPRTESLARRNEYLKQWRMDNLEYTL